MTRTRFTILGSCGVVLVACALRIQHAQAAKSPAPEKNYRLQLVHEVNHAFNALDEDGEESVRIETTMMRTSSHPKVARWRKQLDAMRDKPPLEQLEAVNRMINESVRYRSDYEHWRRQDRWGFPFATLDEGGDCEDYAMLKRVSLRYLGWPQEGIYLLMGFSTYNGDAETHAVLMATLPDGSQVILDSQNPRILAPADDTRFTPMMAINRESFFLVGRALATQTSKGRLQFVPVASLDAVSGFSARSRS